MNLKREGGVTEISLHNAAQLISEHGLPAKIRLYWDEFEWDCVKATWDNGVRHVFTGFAWGYVGEGSRGLEQFFKFLSFAPAISLPTIASWIHNPRFSPITYTLGKQYGFVKCPETGEL